MSVCVCVCVCLHVCVHTCMCDNECVCLCVHVFVFCLKEHTCVLCTPVQYINKIIYRDIFSIIAIRCFPLCYIVNYLIYRFGYNVRLAESKVRYDGQREKYEKMMENKRKEIEELQGYWLTDK